MNEQVEVRFGGSTAGLDNASKKAENDIKGVGKTAEGLKGTFQSIGQSFKNMFSGTNFGDVSTKMRTIRSEMKELVEGASQGNIQIGILGRTLAEAAEHAAPLAAALLGVAVALGALYTVKKVLEFGEAMGDVALKIEQTSQKLGMSAEQVQRWHGVATQVHMDATQMDSGFTRLERSMVLAANGGKTQAAAFQNLGINVRELKNPTEALIAISEKFKDMPDGPKKTAIAMQLMGRAGAQMIPVLNQGKEGLADLMKTADETGSVMSDKLVSAGLAVDEQFNQLHMVGTGLKNMLFEALAPAIHAIVSALVVLGKGLIDSYKKGGTVKVIVMAMAGAFKILASIVVAVGGVFSAFANVAVAAITAVFGPVYTLGKALGDIASGDFKGAVSDIKNGAHEIGTSITKSLSDAMGSIKSTGHALGAIWNPNLPKSKEPLADESGDMDLNAPGLAGGGGRHKKPKDNSKEIAKKKLEAYLAELDEEEAAAQDDYEKKMEIEQKKLDAIKAFYGKDSKEYYDALKHKEQLEREWSKKLKEIQAERIQHQEELATISAQDEHDAADDRINMAREEANQKVALGKMSATQRAQAEVSFLQQETAEARSHENTIFQIKLQSMKDQLALLDVNSDAYRKMNEKIETAERQHQATMAAIDRKGAMQMQKANNDVVNASIAKYKGMVAPVTQAFGQMVNGLLTRTTTLKQGFIQMCDSILSSFISMGVEMVTNWIATQLGLRAAHAATKAAEGATDATAAAAQQATAVATNMSNILSLAPVAGAAAFASTAAIPIVGPALAPGAAAGAMAAVASMAPLAVAEKGFDIPAGQNPLTQLHQKEMVLPAHIAEPLRAMLRSAGPAPVAGLGPMAAASASATRSSMASPGGDTHLHYGPQYGGPQTHSLDQMLERDGHRLIRYLKKAKRDGKLT